MGDRAVAEYTLQEHYGLDAKIVESNYTILVDTVDDSFRDKLEAHN